MHNVHRKLPQEQKISNSNNYCFSQVVTIIVIILFFDSSKLLYQKDVVY